MSIFSKLSFPCLTILDFCPYFLNKIKTLSLWYSRLCVVYCLTISNIISLLFSYNLLHSNYITFFSNYQTLRAHFPLRSFTITVPCAWQQNIFLDFQMLDPSQYLGFRDTGDQCAAGRMRERALEKGPCTFPTLPFTV